MCVILFSINQFIKPLMKTTTIADMISAETIAALYAACPFPIIK